MSAESAKYRPIEGSITKVERFHCRRCDYITEEPGTIELIRKTGTCPACHNGRSKAYSMTHKEAMERERKRRSAKV